METMNIALPNRLKEYVQQRVEQGGYSSASEYIRELIRLDQRESAQTLLEAELLKGLASGPPQRMAADDWSKIRREVKGRISDRNCADPAEPESSRLPGKKGEHFIPLRFVSSDLRDGACQTMGRRKQVYCTPQARSDLVEIAFLIAQTEDPRRCDLSTRQKSRSRHSPHRRNWDCVANFARSISRTFNAGA